LRNKLGKKEGETLNALLFQNDCGLPRTAKHAGITGGSNFTLALQGSSGSNLAYVDHSDMDSVKSVLTGSVKLTFDYTPVSLN
jgi:hypothetical protein